MTVQATEPLLILRRETDEESLLAVFNLGHETQAWTAPDGYSVIDAVNRPAPDGGALPPLAGVLLRQGAP
jgi:alpha-glucosidase